uniref:Uncharacterized protein n=1 Tax=Cyprinodon variegatus TaxID=28743 RepID=A0A3Q2E9H4_CYPVA
MAPFDAGFFRSFFNIFKMILFLFPRFLQICDWLESFIDPFDLDVFTPPLNANLNRLSQRTSVLLNMHHSSALNQSQKPENLQPLITCMQTIPCSTAE